MTISESSIDKASIKDGMKVPFFHRGFLRFIELWLGTCRSNIVGKEKIYPLLEPGNPAVIALWHFSIIYTLFHFRKQKGVIMVSGSKDGEWVARSVACWGQIPVRGSKHKGGLLAIREMTRIMKERCCHAGIVADGSKGPALKAQKGAVVLARDTGVPIVPTGLAARPAIRFNSWDRTLLPLPGSRVVFVYESPVKVPAKARGREIEDYRKLLEKRLNQATRTAEQILSS